MQLLQDVKLKRNITLWGTCALIISSSIGAGIFIAPRGVFLNSGSVGMSFVIWIIAAIFSLLGAVCYAELGTTIESSGGDYSYIYELYGSFWAFLQMHVNVFVIQPSLHAIISLTIAQYLLSPFLLYCEEVDSAYKLLAICCLTLAAALNIRNFPKASNYIDGCSFTRLAILFVMISLSLLFLTCGHTKNFWDPFVNSNTNLLNLTLAFFYAVFAFSGFNSANIVSDEIINVDRNLPLAIFLSLPCIIGLYFLTNIAYVTALPINILSHYSQSALYFSNEYFGFLYFVIPFSVAVANFGYLSSSIMSAARICAWCSKNGHYPKILSLVNSDFNSPTVSILFTTFLASIMALCCDVYTLISYTSFAFYTIVNACVIGMLHLRYKRPFIRRPIKIPIIFPIVYTIMCSSFCFVLIISDFFTCLVAIFVSAIGVPLYVLFYKFSHCFQFLQIASEYLTQFCQLVCKSNFESTHYISNENILF